MSTPTRSSSSFTLLTIALLVLASRTGVATPRAEDPRPEAQPATSPQPLETAELESFLDAFLARKMEKRQVPGAALSVVKDGEIILSRGYGLADLEHEVPVDPATTRFAVASVSKLFTATAVMQLSERGLLSLDDDIDEHLDTLDFERRFPEPLTVFHLLTHSSGIEDVFLFSTEPEQFLPPGDIVSYSNSGITTAGQVIAAASGRRFEDFVAENILGPLDMPSSSFVPVPEDSPEAPIGYSLQQGRLVPNRRPFSDVVPAGSLSSTATEMAHFMLAHLEEGRYGDRVILAPETVREMHRRQAGNHPGVSGVTLGFWESTRNGVRILDQKGDGSGFHAALFLVPAQRLGVFFVCNRQAYGLSNELMEGLVDRFFPGDAAAEDPGPLPDPDVTRYLGSYRWLRVPQKGLSKILGTGMEAQVRPAPDGAVHVSFGGLPIQANTLTLVEPDVFRASSGGEFSREIAFRTPPEGPATHLFSGLFAFERVAWYESGAFLAGAGLLFLVTFLLGAVAVPLMALVRRLRGRRAPGRTRLARVARNLVPTIGVVNLGFLLGLLGLLLSMAARQSFSISAPLKALLCVPPLSVGLALAIGVCAVLAWRSGLWSPVGRMLFSLYALVALAFVPYLAYFNLLGPGR